MMRMISIGGDRAVTARDSQFLGLCQSQYLQPLPKSLSSKVSDDGEKDGASQYDPEITCRAWLIVAFFLWNTFP